MTDHSIIECSRNSTIPTTHTSKEVIGGEQMVIVTRGATPKPNLRTIPRGVSHRRPTEAIGKGVSNNNGGQWFLATSGYSVAEIERRFRWGLVGRVLYERVGAILRSPIRGHIYIQVACVTDVLWDIGVDNEPIWRRVKSYQDAQDRWPEWAVEVCLREIEVELVKTIEEPYA